MSTSHVAVIDYGVGNIYSVCNALTEIGAIPVLTNDHDTIISAERVILPGVGSFSNAINALRRKGIDSAIARFIEKQRPFLGICVGMQLLMDSSNELGLHKGLGHFTGEVIRLPDRSPNGIKLKIPHIGWSKVQTSRANTKISQLSAISSAMSGYFYFVHSYECKPANQDVVLATTQFGGHNLTAAIGKDNVIGVQFHPERSSAEGLVFLKTFLKL